MSKERINMATKELVETPIEALEEIVRLRERGNTRGILDNDEGVRTVWDKYTIESFDNN
jgi:hypothetical protein